MAVKDGEELPMTEKPMTAFEMYLRDHPEAGQNVTKTPVQFLEPGAEQAGYRDFRPKPVDNPPVVGSPKDSSVPVPAEVSEAPDEAASVSPVTAGKVRSLTPPGQKSSAIKAGGDTQPVLE